MQTLVICSFVVLILPKSFGGFSSVSKDINKYINFAANKISSVQESITKNDFSAFLNLTTVNIPEDGLLDFSGLARKYNLNVEEYEVVTDDGYILTLFHIITSETLSNETEVVLMSHGLATTSDDFILRGNTSLIYMLAQKRFDIWAISYRGTRYARKHKTLNPDRDPQFWDFSMHEMGIYDLSATIDFVLKKTRRIQISIVGHSEGTSTIFVLASTKPEYNSKIKMLIALAPIAYFQDCGLVIRSLIGIGPVLSALLKSLGIVELFRYNSVTKQIINFVCLQGTPGYEFCSNVVVGSVAGYDPSNVEKEYFQSVLGHYPVSTSVKNLEHYVQVGNSNEFKQFDYGIQNKKKYGTLKPPKYDLGQVKCKVALMVGANDFFVGLKDAQRINHELPNVVDYYLVPYDKFNHQDFVWGRNSHKVLYDHVLGLLGA